MTKRPPLSQAQREALSRGRAMAGRKGPPAPTQSPEPPPRLSAAERRAAFRLFIGGDRHERETWIRRINPQRLRDAFTKAVRTNGVTFRTLDANVEACRLASVIAHMAVAVPDAPLDELRDECVAVLREDGYLVLGATVMHIADVSTLARSLRFVEVRKRLAAAT
jgi:hypothetical protein